MADLNDILSDNETPLSEEELLRFLDKNCSKDQSIGLEGLANDAFASDALEGLQKIENTEKVIKSVQQLNQQLHQHLKVKKQRKDKSKINIYQWMIIALLLILFICIIGYILVNLNSKNY